MMPKIAKELTAIEISRLNKQGKHAVGGIPGLMFQVNGGSRSWIYRYMLGGKRRDMGLGPYPAVTLAQAKDHARSLKYLTAQGHDPLRERQDEQARIKAERATLKTFKEAMVGYLSDKSPEWKNKKHRQQWENTLTTYALPEIGDLSVSKIQIGDVLSVLRPIWHEKTETASRLRGRIESVIDWAKVHGYCKGENPARWKGNLDKVLPAPSKAKPVKHHKALPYAQISNFITDLKLREGIAARALEFCILTAARSGEVRGATWQEIDLNNNTWTIPAARMKAGKEHRIPLSPQALILLNSLTRHANTNLLFPNTQGAPLSDMTLGAVLKRMGRTITTHGFRSTFRDWAGETQNFPNEVLEHALAHQLKNKTEAAYARGTLFEKRRILMDAWGDECFGRS